MTDRDHAGLRGSVRTCCEESPYPDGKSSITREYSVDGRLLATRCSNPDGSEWAIEQTYDRDGRLLKSTSGRSGDSGSETRYEYDEAGRLLNITTDTGDRTEFRYTEDGRKTSVQTFDKKTILRAQNSAYSGSPWDAAVSRAIGVPLGGKITTIYNQKDQPTEAQILDAGGQVVGRFVRTYDIDGRLLEEKPIWENPASVLLDKFPVEERDQLTPAKVQLMNRTLIEVLAGKVQAGMAYTYDAQGRTTTIRDRTMAFERTTTIAYNGQGDRAEECVTTSGNSMIPIGVPHSIDESGAMVPNHVGPAPPTPLDYPEKNVIHYSYEYDDHGNWTHLTASTSDASPFTVRERKLTYY